MVVRIRTTRKLVRMLPRRRGATCGGAKNKEFKELRRRIKELENRRNGDHELDSDSEEEIEVEQNPKDGDPIVYLISYLSNIGSVRVEILCYDGSLRDETLVY